MIQMQPTIGASSLTLLLMSEAAQRRYDRLHFEHPAYEVLNALVAMPDERKADLYARLAERVTPALTRSYFDLLPVVQKALTENAQEFAVA